MGDTPETAVRYDVQDDVAVLTIDFPPVNALGAPVRDGMMLRLGQALADQRVRSIVLIGANDRFVAGADIREFGKPMVGASLAEINETMEPSPQPGVAAIDGERASGREGKRVAGRGKSG